jgi:hypothetical protein
VICKLHKLIVIAAALVGGCQPWLAFADERGWEFQPYRIRVVVAIDAPGGLAEQLHYDVPKYLQQRVQGGIGPLWSIDVELADPLQKHLLSATVAVAPDDVPEAFAFDGDKLLLLSVRWTVQGFQIAAREHDYYVNRWGEAILSECRQNEALLESVFAAACQTIAPLTQLELAPDNDERVILKPRGAALMRKNSDTSWAVPGEVYLPIFRRTQRTGEVIEGGIQPVPWTFVVVEANQPSGFDNASLSARIHSGNRRPFGVRRIGRIEQLAIALRGNPGDTTIRLHSRTEAAKPLVGYEIYAQNPDDEGLTRIGLTNDEGKLAIPPGEARVRTLYVKNGGQLLARLPIVPGAVPQMDVPLPDDDPRLAAESRLAALREELIDVVARRNILLARVRQKIEQKQFAAAQEMLTAADQLPGRAQFNLTLATAARTLRSNDPQIQRRIDQLIEATQTVMNQYLDVRPINQLHDQLRAAQASGG